MNKTIDLFFYKGVEVEKTILETNQGIRTIFYDFVVNGEKHRSTNLWETIAIIKEAI